MNSILSGDVLLKLMNMSFAAGILILLVILLRLIPVRVPKWTRLVLWAFVAFRLLVPFSFESIFSLIPTVEPIPENIMLSPEPEIHTEIPFLNQTVNPVIQESFTPAPESSITPMQVLFTVLTFLWLLGIAGFLAYLVLNQLQLRRKLRTAVHLKENIYASDRVDSPFVFGFFRPRIYLPFSLKDAYRSPIVAHENAHIRHGDHILKTAAFVILSIYWFHPLVWVSYFLFTKDLELACDERVIREMNPEERADYSEALLSCSVPEKHLLRTPVAFGETAVKSRIRAALNYKKPAFWILLSSVILLAVIAVCFLTNPKKAAGGDGAELVCQMDYDEFSEDALNEFYQNQNPEPVTKTFRLSAFRDFVFYANPGSLTAVQGKNEYSIASGMPLDRVYTVDLSGDGVPEICVSAFFGSGLINQYVAITDLQKKESYMLWDRGDFDYSLYEKDGTLMVQKSPSGIAFPDENSTDSSIERSALTLEHPDLKPGAGALMTTPADNLYGTYILGEDSWKSPSVTIASTGFEITFHPLSSYIGFGSWGCVMDRLTLTTDDGQYHFSFLVKDNDLVYDAKNSSEWPTMTSDELSIPVPEEGSRFRKSSDGGETPSVDENARQAAFLSPWFGSYYYNQTRIDLSEEGFTITVNNGSSVRGSSFVTGERNLILTTEDDKYQLHFRLQDNALAYQSADAPWPFWADRPSSDTVYFRSHIVPFPEKDPDENMELSYEFTSDGEYRLKTADERDGRLFSYKIVLIGRNASAASAAKYVVLTNDPDITFTAVEKSIFSSDMKDHLPDLVVIGMKALKEESAS